MEGIQGAIPWMIGAFKMTETRLNLLHRRLRAAVEQQPEIGVLRKLLLQLGGRELVAPPNPDSAVQLLVAAGFVMAGPVLCKIMENSKCHRNVARVWTQRRDGIVGIGTGYALSGDELWRQHSWGVRREGILETTESRTKYFGILLQGWEADSFAESNRARSPVREAAPLTPPGTSFAVAKNELF
jgi:hypothetical protein